MFLLTFLRVKGKLVTTNVVMLFNFDCTKTQRFFLINFQAIKILKKNLYFSVLFVSQKLMCNKNNTLLFFRQVED
jgi:hypothetical protein